MKNFCEKIWRFKKSPYLCSPFEKQRWLGWKFIDKFERDNEVKLKEESKSVTKRDLKRESIVVVDCNFKATSETRQMLVNIWHVIQRNSFREKVTRANGGCLGFWRRRRTW